MANIAEQQYINCRLDDEKAELIIINKHWVSLTGFMESKIE